MGIGDLPFPRTGYIIGNFPLYDSFVMGSALSFLQGSPVHPAGLEPPDDESLKDIDALYGKSQRTEEEQTFIDYFHALDELRLSVKHASDVEIAKSDSNP